jgi:SpoVK/Ycf46/Vps4 family AAA+-type ATPase
MQNVHNENQKILFTSASNRPWDVDPAAKRPGRFGNLIYIAPPGLKDRFIFFRSYLKTVEHLRISPFGYLRLSLATARYSPADIEEICILAKKEMLYRNVTGGKDYFNRKLTREEYLNESAAGTLPRKPKEILSTGDIIKIIKKDFRGSSLDAWYIESYKAMVGWEEIQKETSKGLILSKTIRRKVRHEGKFTKEEQKIYKPMLKDVKHARSRRFATSLVRGFARAV